MLYQVAISQPLGHAPSMQEIPLCRRITHGYQTTKLKNKTECLQTHDWIRRSDPVPTTSLEFNNIEKVYLVRDRDQ